MQAERRRADAAQRDAADEYRRRSLGNAAVSSQDDDAAALRRKLALASNEIEALRANTKDLRRQIQSECWSWQVRDGGADERGHGRGGSEGCAKFGFAEVSPGTRAAAAALKEVGITGGGRVGGCGDDGSASTEVARLNSLLSERNAQVSVLMSTVEALQTTTSFLSSPRKNDGASGIDGVDGGGGGDDVGSSPSSPRRRVPREKHATFSVSWADVAADADGGVGILNHVGAQGLARHCVALAVRLTSATARAGAAERRADGIAAEMEQQERKIRAAGTAEADLSRRNHLLEKRVRKTAAALNGMRVEGAARLQEAGDEASKLR